MWSWNQRRILITKRKTVNRFSPSVDVFFWKKVVKCYWTRSNSMFSADTCVWRQHFQYTTMPMMVNRTRAPIVTPIASGTAFVELSLVVVLVFDELVAVADVDWETTVWLVFAVDDPFVITPPDVVGKTLLDPETFSVVLVVEIPPVDG